MEAGFHFIFEIFKISILASLYASVLLLLFRAIAKRRPGTWIDLISKRKILFWFSSGFIISMLLGLFMFTYWGDHGLGDSCWIPIGHNKKVGQIDGMGGYADTDSGQINLGSFVYDADRLYASIDNYRGDNKQDWYLIWDLYSGKINLFSSKKEYVKRAKKLSYPMPETFLSYDDQYNKYWNGWRFWLLP